MDLKFRYLLFLLVCLTQSEVYSQGNTFNFEYFSQEDGLTNNQVHCSYQDRRGFMWFGTSQGVNRFDGYRFTRFIHNASDSSSLNGNLVRVIFEDSKGQLFIGTENGGLNLFDRDKERFSRVFTHFKDANLKTVSVNDIKEDAKGDLWIATDVGLLLYKNGKELRKADPAVSSGSRQFTRNFVRVMTFDKTGNLWMGTNNGVFILDTLHNQVKSFALPVPSSLNEEIWEITRDDAGKIWIGTYDNGIFVIDKGVILNHILPDPGNNRSHTVRSIASDKKGNFWIGTRGGVYIYTWGKGIVAKYTRDEREGRSLSGNSILDIFHDSRGDSWIGTRSGINHLVHSKQVFRNFRAMPDDSRYLNSNEIWAFLIDSGGKIWVGTEDGGVNIYDPKSQTFSYLMHKPSVENSLSSNCIKSFLNDGKGNIWIATFRGGINVLNLASGKISHFRNVQGEYGSISDDRVWCLLKDHSGEIWATTSSGVDKYDHQGKKFRHLNVIPPNTQVNWINEDKNGILWIGSRDTLYIYNPSSGNIRRFPENSRAFLQDTGGRVWITTLDKGVALYSENDGPLKYLTEKDGLANNQAISIVEDNNHFLWIGTTNGLSRFQPQTGNFQTFSGKDGLQNSQFNYGAAAKSPEGELLFGGISGFNIFNPDQVVGNGFIAPIVLTDLRLFNKPVEIGTGKKQILTKSITETGELVLPFRQKVITLEFAALNFVNSQSNLYSYFLEGFDNSWNDPSPVRSATYTNLNPGDYTFRVKSVIPGVADANNNISLKIKILPPFWRTWLFKILVFTTLTLLIIALVRFMMNREKLKNELVFEKVRARKLHELDMMKLKFFTNISHEIRTPLTLILGPLEKLRDNQLSEEQKHTSLEIMYRNARQLNQLINQILDFRKLESGSLKLEVADGELVSFIRGIVAQFDHLAREKEIRYTFNSLVNQIPCRFDQDKVEKIVTNLLSNAFKFTDKDGKISVMLAIVFDSSENRQDDPESGQRFIEIIVKDSGKGIPLANLDKIFVRFFQGSEKSYLPGTGIGLSLVRELVKMHQGEIFVASKPGHGSKFTVKLPLWDIEQITQHIPSSKEEIFKPEKQPVSLKTAENEQSKIMLIVEDHADVRLFIRNHFEGSYQILEAGDGIAGWETALNILPDIILCDLLMPHMDGYELLKKLKNDERTSHIPVVILTALASKENEMEGLTAGADDYITKPFDLNLLQAKIENIMAIRQSLKEKYSEEIFLQPRNILISPHDERFMKKAIEIVEEQIGNPDLDIEMFASAVGVSRMQLYRKLNALTDMTVKEFIRDIRLKRAAQLLIQHNQNVSEIAFAVGFRDISHFRKCFRQKFGMNASEYYKSIPKQ